MEVQPFYSLGLDEQFGSAKYVCAADHADLAAAGEGRAETGDAGLVVDVGGEFSLVVVALAFLLAHRRLLSPERTGRSSLLRRRDAVVTLTAVTKILPFGSALLGATANARPIPSLH
jgi:hypothetical protein